LESAINGNYYGCPVLKQVYKKVNDISLYQKSVKMKKMFLVLFVLLTRISDVAGTETFTHDNLRRLPYSDEANQNVLRNTMHVPWYDWLIGNDYILGGFINLLYLNKDQ
jgi:hypothetical protein